MRARLDQVKAALRELRGSAKRLAEALFPADILAYIPGQKLIAAAVVYVLGTYAGLPSEDAIVTLPDVNGNEVAVTPALIAAFVGFYFWPTNKPVVEPKV